MAVSLGRSDVLGEQECDPAESPRSRAFRGRFLPQNQRKIRRYASINSFVVTFVSKTDLDATLETVKARNIVQKESLASKKLFRFDAYLRKGIFGM